MGLGAHGQGENADDGFTDVDTFAQAAVIWSILLFDQAVIFGICVNRLRQYHKLRVLRVGRCIKSLFHVLLMITALMMAPYQTLCLANIERMPDCDVTSEDSLYQLNWELYGLSRLAAPLTVMCLSLVTVLWCDFISGPDQVRAGSFGNLFPSRISLQGAPSQLRNGDRLRILLAATNIFALLVSVFYEAIVIFKPAVLEGNTENTVSFPTQVCWLGYESTRLALVVLMIYYGRGVQLRIRSTGVFASAEDLKQQKSVVRKLMLSLSAICLFVAIGIATRTILILPLFYSGGNEDLPAVFTYVNDRMSMITFEVLVQALPFDAVSLILLWLMRQPPKKKWGFESQYSPLSYRTTLSGDFLTEDGLTPATSCSYVPPPLSAIDDQSEVCTQSDLQSLHSAAQLADLMDEHGEEEAGCGESAGGCGEAGGAGADEGGRAREEGEREVQDEELRLSASAPVSYRKYLDG